MKVLISDYDGTLYTNENDIKRNSEKIKAFRENDNIFIISTARNYSSIKEVCEKYNIIVDYFFCDIGSVILDFNGNIIYENYIEKDDIEKIEKNIKKYINKLSIDRYGAKNKIIKGTDRVVEYKIKGESKLLLNLKQIIEKEVPNVKTQITEDNKFIIHTSTKEDIIEIFLLKMGIKKDYVYTVGDELDDLGMLKKYNGHRMKNCNPIVKENISKEVYSVFQLIDLIKKDDEN